jgi:hypothetical protein
VSGARKALVALLLTGTLVSTAPQLAQAHTPGIRWRWKTTRYEQVAPTKTRVLFWIFATSFRSGYARMRCKVHPTVRVQDAVTGTNSWYTATWNIRWRLRPGATQRHGWWLAVEHPAGTANGWGVKGVSCHA